MPLPLWELDLPDGKRVLYDIHSLAAASGLSISTLGCLETEYHLLHPVNSASDEVMYPMADLEAILRLRELIGQDRTFVEESSRPVAGLHLEGIETVASGHGRSGDAATPLLHQQLLDRPDELDSGPDCWGDGTGVAGDELRLDGESHFVPEVAALKDFYKNVLDHVPAGIITLSYPDLRFVQVNEFYRVFLENPPAELVGRHISDVIPSVMIEELLPLYQRVVETGELIHFADLELDGFGRGPTYWTGAYIPIRDAGCVAYIVALLVETTSRKKAEDDLLQRNRELEALNAIATALSGPFEVEDVVHLALDKAIGVLGVEAVSVRLLDENTNELRLFAHKGLPDDYVRNRPTIRSTEGISGRAICSGDVVLVEEVGVDADVPLIIGHRGFNSGASIPLKSKNRVLGVMNLFSRECRRFNSRDVQLLGSVGSAIGVAIENAKLFAELAEKTAEAELKALQLQSVLARSFNVQEVERKRIARDLHDGIAQLISGALLQIEPEKRETPEVGERSPRVGDPEMAKVLLRQALEEMQATLFALSPPVVELGLTSAVQKYLALYQASFAVPCFLHVSGATFRLPPHVETTVYRIIQEALQNVKKHAQATKTDVFLDFGPGSLKVIVRDDGRGFRQQVGTEEWHLGLMSMQERALSVGGRMDIRSITGRGTKLVFSIPESHPIHAGQPTSNTVTGLRAVSCQGV
ncbi:MAG: GAF domain-containing protein [Chloroflexi bacterium]|nr:GAF domain-containing protein [Chloroflexota bacterium]